MCDVQKGQMFKVIKLAHQSLACQVFKKDMIDIPGKKGKNSLVRQFATFSLSATCVKENRLLRISL
jgi:hypothetical protein